MKITDDQVIHVANLARLALDQHEIEKFRRDLNSILEYMDLLSEIKAPEGMFKHGNSATADVLRPDSALQSMGSSDALSNAPQQYDGFIVVPRVIE